MQEKRCGYVLWTQELSEDSQLADPAALFTAAPVETMRAWCMDWPALTGRPIFIFHTREGEGIPFAPPPPKFAESIPWRVSIYNAGSGVFFAKIAESAYPPVPMLEITDETLAASVGGLDYTVEEAEQLARFHAVSIAAHKIAAEWVKGPIWELFAEQSGGLLVAGIAAARGGFGVALARGEPNVMAIHAINNVGGADLTVRPQDIQGDFREARPGRFGGR